MALTWSKCFCFSTKIRICHAFLSLSNYFLSLLVFYQNEKFLQGLTNGTHLEHMLFFQFFSYINFHFLIISLSLLLFSSKCKVLTGLNKWHSLGANAIAFSPKFELCLLKFSLFLYFFYHFYCFL